MDMLIVAGACKVFLAMFTERLTHWRPLGFVDFPKKNVQTHVALHGNFSSPVCSTDPVKVSKDATSLLVCTRKKFFCLGDAGFL